MQIGDAQFTRKTEPDLFTFALESVMYGTLIEITAMRNLIDQRCENATLSSSTYGYIVHQRLDTLLKASLLTIDTKQKKFFIDVRFIENTTRCPKLTGKFRFEWNFRE
jgi:hypothetical protein